MKNCPKRRDLLKSIHKGGEGGSNRDRDPFMRWCNEFPETAYCLFILMAAILTTEIT